jgi:transposase InsO family protein
VTVYRFIDAQKAVFGVRSLCRVLSVPESSYFDWNHHGRRLSAEREERDRVVVAKIVEFHDASTGTYGSPRIFDDFVDAELHVSQRRIARLMAENGIVGVTGREHTTTTTRRDRMAAPFPDLVQREFLPAKPDTIWYGDITYVWVGAKFWYVATVIDACTKQIVGWSFDDHMRTELITDALHAAIRRRGGLIPAGLIFHSDRGSQYTSNEYGLLCRLYGIKQSMGRRGVCYDNAGAESFFSTLKRELVDRYVWKNADQLRNGLFSYIETWYNSRRRHSTLDGRTPIQVDTEHRQRKAS